MKSKSRKSPGTRKRRPYRQPQEVVVRVVHEYMPEPRAMPVKTMNGEWICSRCKQAAYYDGRCGDGPVLMCKCDDYSADGWADGGNRR